MNAVLARLNRGWYGHRRRGGEVSACEGLRGRAQDPALAGLEQRAFTGAMHDHLGHHAQRQARVMG